MAKCCDQMSPDYAPVCEGPSERGQHEREALSLLPPPRCALPRVWSRNCEIKTMNALSKMYGVRAWQDAGLAMITGWFRESSDGSFRLLRTYRNLQGRDWFLDVGP